MKAKNIKEFMKSYASIISGAGNAGDRDPFSYVLTGLFAIVSPILFPLGLFGAFIADLVMLWSPKA